MARVNADKPFPRKFDGYGLAEFMRIPDRKPLWFIADEVQRTYGDEALWTALFNIPRQTHHTFVIAAGSYGSHTGSTSHSPPQNAGPGISHVPFLPNEGC